MGEEIRGPEGNQGRIQDTKLICEKKPNVCLETSLIT